MKKRRLAWVDEFISSIRPYVYVRLRDNVLIRMPNEAFRLNSSGARIIKHILDGGSVQDFIDARGGSPETELQLERFFTDFSRIWNNEVCENYKTDAIQKTEFRIGYIQLPVLSEVALTYRCNIRCRFCYGDCTQNNDHRQLDTDRFKKVLDIIRYEAEVPSVSFTGGEPVTYRDLPELIKYASKHNKMRVNLITNGTLVTPKKAKEFARAGLSSAQVSIESAYPDEHDAITGVPGSHAASVAGFRALKEAEIHVHPHVTICKINRDRIIDYPAFCKSIGAERFSANLVIPAGRGEDENLTVTYSEIGDIVRRLKAEASKTGIRFMWYSPTPVCLFNPLAEGFGNRGCSACEGLLSVDPEGNVLPCSSWSEPVGNLLKDEFEAVWNSIRCKRIREKESAPEPCKQCRHFAACQGACPLYFNIHGHGELNSAWKKMGLAREGCMV